MPRYIDTDELPNIYTATHQELVLALEEAETADVVEVVRCKDCKHRPIATEGKDYGKYLEFPDEYVCPCDAVDHWYSWMPEDDFFCGKGERREDDG